jgi:hypothetical protein
MERAPPALVHHQTRWRVSALGQEPPFKKLVAPVQGGADFRKVTQSAREQRLA